ncbi:MAG TPA: PIN domain-containing protein [Candidatus Kapabacteria bacterium]|nr:PIN domain-containing protein [Candidatus Kapabacteria bacterium]
MKVILDVNVVLDVLLAREEFRESTELLRAVVEEKIEAFVPLHGLTTIYYFLRKEMVDKDCRLLLSTLLNVVTVVPISHDDVRIAIDLPITDFEDAIVSMTASILQADYIVTRNIRDFAHSKIRAITPSDFLSLFYTSLQ